MAIEGTCGQTPRVEMMLEETLSADEQTQLASHLENCKVCQQRFEIL